jgi:hypothetical protein
MPWTTGDLRRFRNQVQIAGNEVLLQEAENTGAVFVDLFPHSIGHDVCQRVGVDCASVVFPETFPAQGGDSGQRACPCGSFRRAGDRRGVPG